MEWLDSKKNDSVVYVSFGSFAALGEDQIAAIAWGLKRSNCYFLWVVSDAEKEKLPRNFLQETSETRLVVPWCPQLEVLAHQSVGCFMTHCGWNPTREAISLGVPMIAMPQWADQTTNAMFIADVWEVEVNVKSNGEGLVTEEEIECCIKEVMVGETRNKIKQNFEKWKKLTMEALDKGGSSDKDIEDFIAELKLKS